jgi:hypothetical protein
MKPAVLSYVFLATVFVAFLICTAEPAQAGETGCYAHRPKYIEGVFEGKYDAYCTGHNEPELDPLSSAAGSARDFTWKAVLPSDGSFVVSAIGPTFWFDGVLTAPKSLFGQSFLELQF